MATYKVTAPLVQVETSTRGFVQVAKGGELPANVTEAALKNAIDLGFVEKVKDAEKAPEAPVAPTSVKGILEEVGDDAEKAKAALAAEYEAKGDKARDTLVKGLEAVIDAANASSGDGS